MQASLTITTPSDCYKLISYAVLQSRLAEKLVDILKERTDECRKVNHPNSHVKLPNLFGRWLMWMQHTCHQSQFSARYPLFPRSVGMEENKAELVRLLNEHLVDMSSEMMAALVDEIVDVIEQFLEDDMNIDNQEPEAMLPEYEVEHKNVFCGGFQIPIRARLRFLAKQFGQMHTVLAYLKYKPLSLFKGGEVGTSITFFNTLYDIGQATFEGFASPMNCRLLGRPGVRFCSLFEDTDAAFGSLGNFFRIRLTDYPGGWILSPPFVEPVLNDTADKVENVLASTQPGSFWFFVTFPQWPDNRGWQTLNELQTARIDFQPKEFVCQDELGKIILTNYAISVFILGRLPEDVDLLALRERLSVTDESVIAQQWLEACKCKSYIRA